MAPLGFQRFQNPFDQSLSFGYDSNGRYHSNLNASQYTPTAPTTVTNSDVRYRSQSPPVGALRTSDLVCWPFGPECNVPESPGSSRL